MNSIRIILLFTICACFSNLNAQVRLGVQGGIGISKWISVENSRTALDPLYETNELPGLQGGIVAEVKLSKNWTLRPALLLAEKGTAFHETDWNDSSSQKIWLDYAELPLTIMCQVYRNDRFNFKVGGGIYGAYCFSGVQKGKGTSMSIGEYLIEAKVEFSNHNENDLFPIVLKQFDLGYIISSSVEWKRLQILLSYDRGLYSLLPNSSLYNGNYRNRTFSISAAYYVFE